MTKIIINADDLGLNSIVNSEIERFIQDGLITSATMLANGEALEDAIRIAKTYNDISFGVHLCLDEYNSLTKSEVLRKFGIIDDDNVFTRQGVYKIKKTTKELRGAIYDELNAQIEVFVNAGIEISHIDGHHHCHTRNLWILEILSDLAQKYNINIIRRPSSNRIILRNHEFAIQKLSNIKVENLRLKYKTFLWVTARVLFNSVWIRRVKKKFRTTDKFYSYYTFYHNISVLKPLIKNKTIELMCHPGHPDYEIETNLIKERVLDNFIRCKYVSYKLL